MNDNVDNEKGDEIFGEFGLETRNDADKKCVQCCTVNDHAVANTWF